MFSGVIATCAGLSEHDAELISAAIVAFGGGFKLSLCAEVTHVIAQSLDTSKVAALRQHPSVKIPVVAPHWVNDCFSLRRRIPLDNYVFDMEKNETPQCLRASWEPRVSRHISPPDNRSAAVLMSRHVLFSRDVNGGVLEGNSELHSVVDAVAAAGGIVIETPDDNEGAQEVVKRTDIVVARFRESPECRAAIALNKTVGSLKWLISVVSSGVMTAPRDRLLHFPYPRKPIKGFDTEQITITRYTGTQRTYLKELIGKMGGTFTPDLTPRNTVCIALEPEGDKVVKAYEWNIPVVNHTWLEECFATWEKHHLVQRQYLAFPGAAQLRSVLGRVPVEADSIARFAGEVQPQLMQRKVEANVALKSEDTSSVPQDAAKGAPHQSAHAPETDAQQAAAPEVEAQKAAAPEADAKEMAASGAEAQGPAAPQETQAPVQAPREAPVQAPREAPVPEAPREAPVPEAPREAFAPESDAQVRTPEVEAQGRAPPSAHPEGAEQQAPAATEQPNDTNSPSRGTRRRRDTPEGANKRIRQSPVIATTSLDIAPSDARALSAMHVQRTDNIYEATHLVAAQLARTEKMLCAIARGGVPIVTYDWIREMVKRREVVDAGPFALHDAAKESMWDIRLDDVLARANARPGKLLDGHTFYYTRRVQPSGDIFRRIVAAAGGTAVPANGAATARAIADEGAMNHLVSCVDDKAAAAKIVEQCARLRQDGKPPVRVWTSEVVLSGVLRQDLVWASTFELAI